jgi:hypothetical protein
VLIPDYDFVFTLWRKMLFPSKIILLLAGSASRQV